MDPSRRPGRFAAVVVVSALTLTGCASMNVGSFLERGANFTQYHTYNWEPVDRFDTGDPRLDNNPFFQERVRAAVEKQLGTRGFEKATSGTPELLLHYHARIHQRLDVNGVDRRYGYCNDCRPYVYEAGTLVLDLVDGRTNQLVWRGWVEGSMDGIIDDQQLMEKKIDNAVAKILEQLPRKL